MGILKPQWVAKRIAIALLFTLATPLQGCQWLSGHASISPTALHRQLQTQAAPLILDVRSTQEYEVGHIPGAIHIDYRQLSRRLDKLPTDRNQSVIVYCERGVRAAIATATLRQAGFTQILHLEGDMKAWRAHRLPIEQP